MHSGDGAAPPGAGRQDGSDTELPPVALTPQQLAVLREAGSLAVAMPPVAERASTKTLASFGAMVEDALTVRQAAALLQVSPNAVRRRVRARTLLGVQTSAGWRLPRFQFTDAGQLRGFDQVLPALPSEAHPLVVQAFLTRPHVDLRIDGEPVSPRHWLAAGRSIARVVAAAAGVDDVP